MEIAMLPRQILHISFAIFHRHVKKLKDEYLGEKVQRYLDLLPEVLHEMFPDFKALGEG